jgi:GAF domain-containing protein
MGRLAFPMDLAISEMMLQGERKFIAVARDITTEKQIANTLQEQLQETLLLNKVIATAASAMDTVHILETICTHVAGALELPQAAVALLNEENNSLDVVAEFLAPARFSAIGISFPIANNPINEFLMQEKKPLVINNTHEDPRTAPISKELQQRGTQSLMIVPLMHRKKVIGTLGLDAVNPRKFTNKEVMLVQNVAAATSQALANANLFEDAKRELAARKKAEAALQRQLQETKLLNRIISTATSALEPRVVLQTLCTELGRIFTLPQTAVALFNEDRTTLEVTVEYLTPGKPSTVGTMIPVDESNQATLFVLREKKPLLLENAQTDSRQPANLREIACENQTLSILIVPLTCSQ